mgnify:CR=1 FL=1
MSPLKKRITRRAELPHRGRRLVVTLYPGDMIGLRHERCRAEEVISLAGVYDFAVKTRVANERWKRMQERRAKRGRT